jgi:hypothetical protein
MKHWIILAAGLSLTPPALAFDWNATLKDAVGKTGGQTAGTAATSNTAGVNALSNADISAGLKEALTRGADTAVAQLGVKDGFYGNPALKIPLPKNLQKASKAMRMLGMDKQADELVLAMNRAAEAAVPQAKPLLVDAVKGMTLDDARGILTGGPTSATDFFRKKTEAQLTERFTPIVKATTDKVGLAQQYNRFGEMAAQFNLVDKSQASVEQYVTQQSLDRLYRLIGEKEQAIRANPLQAGSDLLKQVFGAVSGK